MYTLEFSCLCRATSAQSVPKSEAVSQDVNCGGREQSQGGTHEPQSWRQNSGEDNRRNGRYRNRRYLQLKMARCTDSVA